MCKPFPLVTWVNRQGSVVYGPSRCATPYTAYDWRNRHPAVPIQHGGLREPAPVEPHIGGPERPEEHAPHIEHLDWSSKYPTEVILHGPLRKEAALTFDDGPDGLWTPMVLDALARFHVKATFFVVGRRCEANPDVLRRIAREGHVIGNHSWNHPNLAKLTAAEDIRSQIQRTDEVIRRLTGITPVLFRPPYGALSDTVVEEAVKAKKKVILWNVDSLDWMQLSGRQVAANILAHTRPGSIVLQHSAGGVGESLQGSVDALPVVIQTLRGRSYKLLTVPQLLNLK
ncbi:polysaccharide deacetylase family protein [Paenibacillus naphthalenovorans]|uniref:polysaccharide deacetylase family protein n=1 Tax=Paenibacillus naphthalenovorans TaxID=162209 RepID=UPI0010B6D865|nr:polysaccharide deacetylase family protein [Paenibacillus naphthalenovorans]GCL73551.1 polysaccharide deacetylase family protein [Paenibacillus naphthalenovorans]